MGAFHSAIAVSSFGSTHATGPKPMGPPQPPVKPTLKTVTPIQTTTTAVPVVIPTNTPFYLKSTCDNSCIGNYGGDGQTFTNAYTQIGKSFDQFYFDPLTGQLIDSTIGNICVASQAGGSATQFQCSGDLDGDTSDDFGQANGFLTFRGSSDFYGCGTSSATDQSSTGLNYFTKQGNPDVCKLCRFTIVKDASQCGSAPPPTTTAITPGPTPSTTQTPIIPETKPPKPCPTPVCPNKYLSVYWNGKNSCYKPCNVFDKYSCKTCPRGTSCSACGKTAWACLPPKNGL